MRQLLLTQQFRIDATATYHLREEVKNMADKYDAILAKAESLGSPDKLGREDRVVFDRLAKEHGTERGGSARLLLKKKK